ncbi:MAG TPA: histidine kinase [Candidatus Acidoferrales bacterium]|nr:histidine kinase [Candidatus Acidoferrales bacterium]
MVAELKTQDPAKFPGFWTLQAVGFGCFTISSLIANFPSLGDLQTLRTSGSYLIWTFAASCLLRFVCRSLLQRGLSWVVLELSAFAWCIPFSLCSGFLDALTAHGHLPSLYGWLVTSMQIMFILVVWCSLYFSIKMWQQSMLERERLLRAETEAREAKLSVLRYQLNPHFLFNSLNAVSTLVLEGKSLAATRMLAQIGDLLRTILDGGTKLEIPLSEEIAFIEQYLSIENTRLGSRLRTKVSIAPETLDALVPSMLLQPLVENAVRHGVAPLTEGGDVYVASRIQDGNLHITIRNSGPSYQRPRAGAPAGIGLRNTAERLETLYSGRHTFALEWLPLGGCEVVIELPFRSNEPKPESRSCAS